MTDMRSRKKRAQDEAARKAAASYRATPGGARDMRSLGNFVTAMDGHRYDGMAEGTVMVTVSHSNLKQKHVDLRFDLHTTVGDVKARLSLHNGTNAGDMRLANAVSPQTPPDICNRLFVFGGAPRR